MKLTGSIQYPLLITSLDSGGQKSKVKVTAGRRGGEGIQVDVSRSPSSRFYYSCLLYLLICNLILFFIIDLLACVNVSIACLRISKHYWN